MAEGLQGTLTQKLGPAPVWMWLVGGGIALWLVSRSGLLSGILGGTSVPGSSSGASAGVAPGPAGATPAPGDQASAGAALSQEIGLLQQLQGFQQQSYQNNLQQVQQTQQTTQALTPPAPPAPPTPPAAPSTITLVSQPRFGELASQPGPPYYSAKGELASGQAGPFFRWGQTLNVVPGQAPGPNGVIAVQGPGGNTVYVSPLDIAGWGGAGGIGGPSIPASFHAIAGRPALGAADAIFRPGHPLLRAGGAGPLYPHYAMGGPRQIHQIGAMVGVHPARVLAPNAGLRRGTAVPGQVVRIA